MKRPSGVLLEQHLSLKSSVDMVKDMTRQPSKTVYFNTVENGQGLPTQTYPTVNGNEMERLHHEIREVTTLYNVGVAVGSSLNLKEVVWALYKESGRLIDVTSFAIAIYDSQANTLDFCLAFDRGERIKPFVLSPDDDGLICQILSTQAPLLIPDLSETAHVVETDQMHPKQPQARTWLGVPIVNPALVAEHALGVILAWNDQPTAFNDHDLWLLSAVATQAAIAIRNAKLFEASQRRAREMVFINNMARTLSSTLHLDEVLTRIMKQVEGMLDAEAGSLLLTDPASGDLVFQIALGAKADEIKPFRIPKGEGIAGEVAETGQPLLITDVAKDERHFKKLDNTVNFFTRNIICVPLVLQERVIGVLEVMNKKVGNFTEHDLKLLTSIASYAAVAIDNARLHESVLSERDRVITAEEGARKKLARDLHDGPTQWVSGILMSIDFCKQAIAKDPEKAIEYLTKEFEEIEDLAKRSVQQLRTALFELRPLALETQGLEAALEVFLERRQKDIQGSTSTKLTLNKPYGEISRQDDKVESTIFALVQETVNNAIKHAKAANIIVELRETAEAIYTIIRDDGQGFDVDAVMDNYEERGSLGMVNLRERTEAVGGELNIHSKPGEGTSITIRIPKESAERQKRRTYTGPLKLPTGMLNTQNLKHL